VRPHRAVVHWIKGVPDRALFLSALTVGELPAGAETHAETRSNQGCVNRPSGTHFCAHTHDVVYGLETVPFKDGCSFASVGAVERVRSY
jgi:hypothetical protein